MILTQENISIVGITQEPSTREYYLVFYHEIRPILGKIIQRYEHINMQYMEYGNFHELEEIGSSCYKTVYTAKYRNRSQRDIPETVVLKCFKNFDQTPELFISEVGILFILIYQPANAIFNLTPYI